VAAVKAKDMGGGMSGGIGTRSSLIGTGTWKYGTKSGIDKDCAVGDQYLNVVLLCYAAQ